MTEQTITAPTADDVQAWEEIQAHLHNRGAILTAWDALQAGHGYYPLLLSAAAIGNDLDDVWEMLRLEPDQIAECVFWSQNGCNDCGNFQIDCTCKEPPDES